jgi:hypothetical protein
MLLKINTKSCQNQFTGSRCELYNSNSNQNSQTSSNTNNNYNANNNNNNNNNYVNTNNVIPQPTNLCNVYTSMNRNICQNGGQCVFISNANGMLFIWI